MSRKATKNLDWDQWLTAWWGPVKRDGPDLHFSGPRGCDRHFLYGVFACFPSTPQTQGEPRARTFVEELEARGYDITTLEFRIRQKDGNP